MQRIEIFFNFIDSRIAKNVFFFTLWPFPNPNGLDRMNDKIFFSKNFEGRQRVKQVNKQMYLRELRTIAIISDIDKLGSYKTEYT